MHIEVDQSGKVELLSVDTIIACSNDRQCSVKIPKKIKQELVYNHKKDINQIKCKLFCIGVYCCIERFLQSQKSDHSGLSSRICSQLRCLGQISGILEKDNSF